MRMDGIRTILAYVPLPSFGFEILWVQPRRDFHCPPRRARARAGVRDGRCSAADRSAVFRARFASDLVEPVPTRTEERLLCARRSTSPDQARFILGRIFRSLRKQVDRSTPRVDRTLVDHYMNRDNNYSAEDAERKDRFVRETVRECAPASVLDIGANNGHFSRIAAESGARTVAIEHSPA